MTYLIVDENRQGWITHCKSAERFFKIHGGNKISIIDEDGHEEKYEQLQDGRIIEIND